MRKLSGFLYPDGLVCMGFALQVVTTEIRSCSKRSLIPLSMSSFGTLSFQEDSRGASAFTARGLVKIK